MKNLKVFLNNLGRSIRGFFFGMLWYLVITSILFCYNPYNIETRFNGLIIMGTFLDLFIIEIIFISLLQSGLLLLLRKMDYSIGLYFDRRSAVIIGRIYNFILAIRLYWACKIYAPKYLEKISDFIGNDVAYDMLEPIIYYPLAFLLYYIWEGRRIKKSDAQLH